MAHYIVLMNWTEQGIKSVKDAPARLDKARKAAKKKGVKIEEAYLTIGAYDMVFHAEADSDEKLATFLLMQGSAGNIRTTTLKAFDEAAYRKIVKAV